MQFSAAEVPDDCTAWASPIHWHFGGIGRLDSHEIMTLRAMVHAEIRVQRGLHLERRPMALRTDPLLRMAAAKIRRPWTYAC